MANFTDRVIFADSLENLTQAQKYFTQVSLVPLVTNSMSKVKPDADDDNDDDDDDGSVECL